MTKDGSVGRSTLPTCLRYPAGMFPNCQTFPLQVWAVQVGGGCSNSNKPAVKLEVQSWGGTKGQAHPTVPLTGVTHWGGGGLTRGPYREHDIVGLTGGV